MQYFSNLELIKNLASQIVKDRKYNYNEDQLNQLLENRPQINQERFHINNSTNNEILCSLFTNRTQKYEKNKKRPCIVYLHGLGSNRLEVTNLLKDENNFQFDICSFDFSGSGKSEGKYTTYGLQQHKDIYSVVQQLQKRKYEIFIIWGRSMGGVSGVLYNSKYKNQKVKCMILDSTFSSFEQVAIQLAAEKSIIPQFMIKTCLEPLKKCFTQNYQFNPFQIDITKNMKQINSRICILYSKKDKIVNCNHSKKLIANCKRDPQIIQIQQDHNSLRKQQTLNSIYEFINKSLEYFRNKNGLERSRSRGISLCSKQKKNGQDIISIRGRNSTYNVQNEKGMKYSQRRGSQDICLIQNKQNENKQNKRRSSIFSKLRQEQLKSIKTEIQLSPKIRQKQKITIINSLNSMNSINSINSLSFQSDMLKKQNKKNLNQNNTSHNKQNLKPTMNMIRRNRFYKK